MRWKLGIVKCLIKHLLNPHKISLSRSVLTDCEVGNRLKHWEQCSSQWGLWGQQRHLGVCEKREFLGLTAGLLTQNLWGWVSGVCPFTRPASDSLAGSTMRSTVSRHHSLTYLKLVTVTTFNPSVIKRLLAHLLQKTSLGLNLAQGGEEPLARAVGDPSPWKAELWIWLERTTVRRN